MNRLNSLQKEILVWIGMLLLIALLGAFYIQNTPNDHPGIIRLHITANSNSPEDQAVKLKVRNEIIKYMGGAGADGKTGQNEESARKFILEHIDEIESISETAVKANGFDYSANAALKVTFIPEKSYEDLSMPAGNYEALNITLGEGNGHNWWCVIFPQLCLIGEDNGTEKIVLKSKVKELIKDTEFANGRT